MTALGGTTRLTLASAKRTPSTPATKIICSCNSGLDRLFVAGPVYGNPPGIVQMITGATGASTVNIVASSQPGTNWVYRFGNASTRPIPDATLVLDQYDVLHLTNISGAFTAAHPLAAQDQTDLNAWVDKAMTLGRGGAGCEVLLWTAWAMNGPNFLYDSLSKMSAWTSLVNASNARLAPGQKPVRVIPGVWLWYKMWQDAQAATEPTPGFFNSLYGTEESPPWHQYDKGNWVNACLNIACIYGIDPLTIPTGPMLTNVEVQDGNNTIRLDTPPTDVERRYVCAKIKEILNNDPNNLYGIDTSSWA